MNVPQPGQNPPQHHHHHYSSYYNSHYNQQYPHHIGSNSVSSRYQLLSNNSSKGSLPYQGHQYLQYNHHHHHHPLYHHKPHPQPLAHHGGGGVLGATTPSASVGAALDELMCSDKTPEAAPSSVSSSNVSPNSMFFRSVSSVNVVFLGG
ncbi:histidine-rich glycoprotein [Aplysia californica]|uniref:Histidine-rich glycoprotein n=1 Tax=Aplysia californica TaxID=6500 RepID=A0ABM0K4J5_APLCA|nr:histidine-rich glycoprotein [Aplysia californica]